MTIVASVLVIGLLIFIHEMGHYMAARRVGVAVHEFALGFGPRVLGWMRGGTRYSLRLVPLGGFVRMAGVHPGEDEEEDEGLAAGESFSERSVSERMVIIGAGSAMNFVLAIALFALIFGTLGITEATLVVDSVEAGFPADEAGMLAGDRILAVDGSEVRSWNHLVLTVQEARGQPLDVVVEREGGRIRLEITPIAHPDEPGTGVIGIRPVVRVERLGLMGSLVQGLRMTGLVIVGFMHAIARLLQGASGPEVVGIIGIGQEIGEATRMGLPNLAFLAAVLSANLGLINLLPIPALDGSRLVFLGIEGVRGRPVDPDKENFIHFIGFALLLFLAIFVAYRDLVRLGGGGM